MDDRSERLRKRRKQSTGRGEDVDRTTGPADSAEPSETDNPSEPSKPEDDADGEESPDRSGRDGGDTPVKEEQIGTYMYLPESQTKDLRRRYNVLKAEYEFEYDEEFEKNRHFYPLVVQYGLDSLEGLDASEIRTRLREFYE